MEESFVKLNIKDDDDVALSIPNAKQIKKQSKNVELIVEDVNKNTMLWINWTTKSNDILFRTTIKGVGDG